MRHLPTSGALLAGISALLIAFGTSTMAVAGSGATQVSGLFTPDSVESPTCTDHPDALQRGVMTGSLEGCWYVDTVTSEKATPSGGYKATGTETFIGCLDDACGQIFTTFTFTAKFNADGSEDHGRCHHPIVGGSGDFAGATGVINMHDLPNGCATYKGHLTF